MPISLFMSDMCVIFHVCMFEWLLYWCVAACLHVICNSLVKSVHERHYFKFKDNFLTDSDTMHGHDYVGFTECTKHLRNLCHALLESNQSVCAGCREIDRRRQQHHPYWLSRKPISLLTPNLALIKKNLSSSGFRRQHGSSTITDEILPPCKMKCL